MTQLDTLFPTTEKANIYIQELDKIEWPIYTGNSIENYTNEMYRLISNVCGNVMALYLTIPQNIENIFNFYRVSELDEIKNLNLRCEYSYPPISYANSNLRANLSGHPVFYSSSNPILALLEYVNKYDNPKEYLGKEFVMSYWKLKPNETYNISPFVPINSKNPIKNGPSSGFF